MVGLADVDGFKICIQDCMWLLISSGPHVIITGMINDQELYVGEHLWILCTINPGVADKSLTH